jgi:hypothetical protein
MSPISPHASGDQRKVVDLAETERFLTALDPTTKRFTFQTYGAAAQILHGTLAQHAHVLTNLNRRGANICVTINKTDFKGRGTKNIVAVRALFTNSAACGDCLNIGDTPDIVVQVAPDCFDIYWLVDDDFPLVSFAEAQKSIAEQFNGNASLADLAHVMLLPGFVNHRANCIPTLVNLKRAVHLNGIHD